MILDLKKMGFEFDDNDNVVISKTKLFHFIKQLKLVEVISENEFLPTICYLLVDRNGKDYYVFSKKELEEWELDGSCEIGDKLFEMQLLKKY